MKKARIAVLALAVAAGGAAFVLGTGQKSANVAPTPAPAPQTVDTDDVLVAAHDLSLGKQIAQGDLAWQPWPKSVIGPTMLKKSDDEKMMTDLNGSIVRSSFVQGEPVRKERLVKGNNAGFLSAILPSGKRAVAINIDAQGSTSAGGFVLPNDRVDVVRTVKIDGTNGSASETQTDTLLQNIKVLAIGQNIEEKNGQPVVVGSNATLELDPSQAETIILAQRTGQLSLTLRSMLDASKEASEPEKMERSTTIVRYGVATETAIK